MAFGTRFGDHNSENRGGHIILNQFSKKQEPTGYQTEVLNVSSFPVPKENAQYFGSKS